jgi:hypothetical protein
MIMMVDKDEEDIDEDEDIKPKGKIKKFSTLE